MHPAFPMSIRAADRSAAIAGYRAVSLEARVAGASPHMLVQLLYDRLAALVGEMATADAAGDAARRLRAVERAVAILENLDQTLDRRRGGRAAELLADTYGLIRARIVGNRGLDEAQAATAMLRESWRAIAPSGRG